MTGLKLTEHGYEPVLSTVKVIGSISFVLLVSYDRTEIICEDSSS